MFKFFGDVPVFMLWFERKKTYSCGAADTEQHTLFASSGYWTNEAFTGLERHEGKRLMTKISFWGGVSL